MLFRCPCHAFQGKGKRYKRHIKKSFIKYTKKIISQEKNNKIDPIKECIIIFLEPGGSYDECSLLLIANKIVKKKITVFFIDEEYERTPFMKAFSYIQKLFSKNQRESLYCHIVSSQEIKDIMRKKHEALIYLFALDEYYFLYDEVVSLQKDEANSIQHKGPFFFARLHSVNYFLTTHRMIFFEKIDNKENIVKKEYIGTKKKIHTFSYKNKNNYL